MTSSTYIARLMGPVLLVIGIGMAVGLMLQGEGYSSLLREFIGSRSLIFITGILALVAGLAIVNTHNLWVRDWRFLVTVLGWLLVIRGITLLVFPSIVQTLGDRVLASQGGHHRRRVLRHRDRGHSLHHGIRGSLAEGAGAARRRRGRADAHALQKSACAQACPQGLASGGIRRRGLTRAAVGLHSSSFRGEP